MFNYDDKVPDLDLSPHRDSASFKKSEEILASRLNQFDFFCRRLKRELAELDLEGRRKNNKEFDHIARRAEKLAEEFSEEIYQVMNSLEYFMAENFDQLTFIQKNSLNQFRIKIASLHPQQITAMYWRLQLDFNIESPDLGEDWK